MTEKAIAEGKQLREVAGLDGVTWDGARALDPVPERAVASLNTHDTPSFAGFWHGADLDDRTDRGLLTEAQALDERRGRGVSTGQLARSLARTGAAECAGHLGRTPQLETQDALFLEASPRVRRPGRNAGGDRQSNSCTNRYNTANENELRHIQSNDGKSPNGPLCQRGRAEGPGDFCL